MPSTMNDWPADAAEVFRRLSAESDIRRLISRYMRLCDLPLPDADLSEAQRVHAIAALFCEDGVWEGVGEYYENQFGRLEGRARIAGHFSNFFNAQEPRLIFNCHYLTTENIEVKGDVAEGLWVQFQPWIYADSSSLLRSSRLRCLFRREQGVWKIAHYRTENVFIAPLPPGWATTFPKSFSLLRSALS
ncbi:nuclear transport factor 2 family protein [Azohydromonas lata]|uniref:nuclear transport factor 2 family protein n=1 Tax=Azohydromonas lata TaxID=45677 RepID=UPI000B0F8522|nr:nuclear transport factor 2 family protein [Azohydromonas lata]